MSHTQVEYLSKCFTCSCYETYTAVNSHDCKKGYSWQSRIGYWCVCACAWLTLLDHAALAEYKVKKVWKYLKGAWINVGGKNCPNSMLNLLLIIWYNDPIPSTSSTTMNHLNQFVILIKTKSTLLLKTNDHWIIVGKHFVPRNSGRNSGVVVISEWSLSGVLLYINFWTWASTDLWNS